MKLNERIIQQYEEFSSWRLRIEYYDSRGIQHYIALPVEFKNENDALRAIANLKQAFVEIEKEPQTIFQLRRYDQGLLANVFLKLKQLGVMDSVGRRYYSLR